MSFTYDPATDIGKVRFELGDDAAGQGVKPDGSNFTDEEIQAVLTREHSVMRAVAGICETLATRYTQLCDISVGPRRESLSQIRDGYRARAADLRRVHGGAGNRAFSISPNREDGYAARQREEEYGA